MNPYITFTAAAAITYALRASMTVAGVRVARSGQLKAITTLATPAVLAVMIASAVATRHGHVAPGSWAEVAAVAIAFATARRTGNLGLALAVGLPVYWIGGLAGLA